MHKYNSMIPDAVRAAREKPVDPQFDPDRFMKNCNNCKHLWYYEKETPEDFSEEGFACNKRDLGYPKAEERFLKKLQDPVYRKRAKPCAEIKDGDEEINETENTVQCSHDKEDQKGTVEVQSGETGPQEISQLAGWENL